MRAMSILFCAALPLVLSGCNVVGPAALGGGRSAYNSIVNQTEDEQLLSAIVRQRYDETFGLLSVTSITANIRFSSSVGVNAGFGPRSSYDGNLVPLSASVVYEENPTISYVPVRGEQFVERMLAPLTAEQTLLLARMRTPQCEPMRLLIRRVNGLANPLFAPSPGDVGPGFDRFIDLFTRLRGQGVLDVVRLPTGEYELLLHDLSQRHAAESTELLRTIGVALSVTPGSDLRIPMRFFVGSAVTDAIEIETATALDVLRAAAQGVELPTSHVAEGIAGPSTGSGDGRSPLIVHASKESPLCPAVSIGYRDHWYFVDARDAASKQTLALLRTLIGLRLDTQTDSQRAPVLTVPVGR